MIRGSGSDDIPGGYQDVTGSGHPQPLGVGVHRRQLRGNLPQAFLHAGLLECAVRLSPDVRLGA